ncbi:MAG: glycosyltransferase family 39 protein [Arenicellales bacterium]
MTTQAGTKYLPPGWIWLVLFVPMFTLFHWLRQDGQALNADMLENYAWGIAWQAGYFKHPPLFAWATALWFSIFPRQHWAYFLLSAMNACLAFAVIGAVARRYLEPRKVPAAVLMLTLVPFYFTEAYKYNANVALLPLWPLVVYCYLRVLETERRSDAALLGIAAALALLTKYYSIFLLAALLGHALTDSAVRRLFRSSLFYVALAVLAACVAPHVYWLAHHDFVSFEYISERVAINSGVSYWFAEKLIGFLLALPFFIIIPIGLIFLLSRRHPAAPRSTFTGRWRSLTASRDGRLLLWVCTAPCALTALYCLATWAVPHTNWLIPAGFGWTILAVRLLPEWDVAGGTRLFFRILAVFWTGFIAAALLLPARTGLPMIEASRIAVQTWEARYGSPPRIVGGFRNYADAVAFYARRPPQVLQRLSYRLTPWIRPEDIRRYGALFICDTRIPQCMNGIKTFEPAPRLVKSIEVRHADRSASDRGYPVSIFIVPPSGAT